MQHRTLVALVFIVGVGSGQRRGLKRFDRGGWPAQVDFSSIYSILYFSSIYVMASQIGLSYQDPSGLGPDLGGWPARVYVTKKFALDMLLIACQNHMTTMLMIYRRCVHIMCLLRSYPRMEIYHGDVFPPLLFQSFPMTPDIWKYTAVLVFKAFWLSYTCSVHISLVLYGVQGESEIFQTCFCKDLYGHTFNSQHLNLI